MMLKGLAHKVFRRLTGGRCALHEAEALLKSEVLPEALLRARLPVYIASRSWQVRNVAVKLIERLKDPAWYPLLINKVRNGSEAGIVVRNAVSAIRRLGLSTTEAEHALRRALDADYWEVRCEAVRALAELFEPTALRTNMFLHALRPRPNGNGALHFNERNFEVRAAVAAALGGCNRHETVLPVLQTLAADSHWLVRHQSAVGMVELGCRRPEVFLQMQESLNSIDMLSEGCRSDFPFAQTVASLRKVLQKGPPADPLAVRRFYIDLNRGWNRKQGGTD